MRLPIALAAGLAVALVATQASLGAARAAPPVMEIKDAVAQVVVIPENRADIRVEFVTQNSSLPLKLKTVRNRTIIDGRIDTARIRSCRGAGGAVVVTIAGVGDVPLAQMP